MLGILPLIVMAQEIKPYVGIVIANSTKIAKGEYSLPIQHPDDKPKGAIIIRGDNITVDFQGAVLRGTPANTPPDKRQGTGVEVHGKNVTIKNVVVRGYKNGLIAFNSPGIKVLDSDFSYNWKQHLLSTLEREDVSDWMSYHHNDNDEWLYGNSKEGIPAYGGAIYLSGCDKFEVQGCTATGGQNGLMLNKCNNGSAWNNNFSFLSSLGVGMYRSSRNKVMHNKIDWCVRGYSHGVYNRGQDSAGILVYEQSSHNVFAYNSVTHGGDGFFLWAGQSTMEDAKGGCNDNLLYGNDFSHAPTNGIEATFSSNTFANNLVLECWHGIWGGYSYETDVIGNVFGYNAQSIAWEHGQNNVILKNLFYRENEGISLWMNATQDPNWGYPKHRDTKSHGYSIKGNTFRSVSTNAIKLKDTADVSLESNTFWDCFKVLEQSGTNSGLRAADNWLVQANSRNAFDPLKPTSEGFPDLPTMKPSGNPTEAFELDQAAYIARFNLSWFPFGPPSGQEVSDWTTAGAALAPIPMKGGQSPFLTPGEIRGRRYILVDEWGPHDFRSPIIWPRGEARESVENAGRVPESVRDIVHRFEVLGPKGSWRVVDSKGVAHISASSGQVPAVIDVKLERGKATDLLIELEFTGDAITTPFGENVSAGKPYRFSYREFFVPIDWNVRWFAWDESNDPRTKEAEFQKLISGTPIKQEATEKLEYTWYGAIGPNLPADHFATVAEGDFEIPDGVYDLKITTDDGMRAWVDGVLVIKDAWKYQGPTPYSARLKLGGKHHIRIEHFEIDGFSTLQAQIVPIRAP